MDTSTNGRTPHAQPAHSPTRTRTRIGILLGTATVLAAATLPVSAAPQHPTTPTPTPPPDPVVLDCSSQPQTRPDEYLLACGDGNNRLINLHWHTWNHKTATATGTDMINDCNPYCAAGHFRPYPVTVTLSNPQPWPNHPNTQRYTTIRLLYTHKTPTPTPKDVTYQLVYDTPNTP